MGGGDTAAACLGTIEDCNDLDLSSAPVVQVFVEGGDAPEPTGGILPEGVGVLTEVTLYSLGEGGGEATQTFMQMVHQCCRKDSADESSLRCLEVQDGGQGPIRRNFDVSTEATTLATTTRCGSNASGVPYDREYSVVGNTVTWIDGGPTVTSFTFTYDDAF